MALELTGELLAVTTQHVEGGSSGEGENRRTWDAFDSVSLSIFDPADGRVTEARIGRDFPGDHLSQLRHAADKRQRVRVAVFLSRGRIYATELVDANVPALKSA